MTRPPPGSTFEPSVVSTGRSSNRSSDSSSGSTASSRLNGESGTGGSNSLMGSGLLGSHLSGEFQRMQLPSHSSHASHHDGGLIRPIARASAAPSGLARQLGSMGAGGGGAAAGINAAGANAFSPGSSSGLYPNGAASSRGKLSASSSSDQADQPTLHHSFSHHGTSVLSLAVCQNANLVFSGSQAEDIYVWDLDTFQAKTQLVGHTASVLALELAPEKGWLFSASGDSTVRVWDTTTLQPLFVIHPADDKVGDIFALAWNEELQTLYLGCQNTSIQWICFKSISSASHDGGSSSPVPIIRPHKFFDQGPHTLSRSLSSTPGGSHQGTPRNFTPSRSPVLTSRPPIGPRGGSTSAMPRHPSTSAANPASSHHGGGDTDEASTSLSPKFSNSNGAATTSEPRSLQVDPHHVVPYAHNGYIYSLALLGMGEGTPAILASGSGDEDVKLWSCTKNGPELIRVLHNSPNGVLALASWGSGTLFAGMQSGQVDVWDMETLSVIRTLDAHDDDVLSLCTARDGTALYTASADGFVKRWDSDFRCTTRWEAHRDAIALCCVVLDANDDQRCKRVITGGSDEAIRIWDVPVALPEGDAGVNAPEVTSSAVATGSAASTPTAASASSSTTQSSGSPSACVPPVSSTRPLAASPRDDFLSRLSRFVSFRSVSSDESCREECRQCAHWLKSCLSDLGAEVALIPGASGRNPIVLATFRARGRKGATMAPSPLRSSIDASGLDAEGPREKGQGEESKKRALCYFHYDVIGAGAYEAWTSSPWKLAGRDGYLYARGVSDDKGPCLATAYAASELLKEGKLTSDIVMLIEGEEEAGGSGFQDALTSCRDKIGPIDVILLSNSYWLGEDTPCLTTGLRGVVQAEIEIDSGRPDAHSGVDGGAIQEPILDMIKVLSDLTDGNQVRIPSFYSRVRPVTAEERQTYEDIAKLKHSRGDTAESLMARWRLPSLSVHRVVGSSSETVIPSRVTAHVSLRLVPDQDLDEIISALTAHVEASFGSLRSPNKLSVQVKHRADWWLGVKSSYATALAEAVEKEWEMKAPVVRIREGGSIPAIAMLEREFDALAVHLPMGQSSDRAHLADERIRLLNLQKGKNVVKRFFASLAALDQP